MVEWRVEGLRNEHSDNIVKYEMYKNADIAEVNGHKYFIVANIDGEHTLKQYSYERSGSWSKPYPTDVGPIHDLEAAKVACVLLNGGGE